MNLEPVFGFILNIGDKDYSSEPPVLPLLMAWYAFALVAFACQQRLAWTQLKLSAARSIEIPLMQTSLCGLVVLFDFWIRPAWRLFYAFLLGSDISMLHSTTKFILFSVPTGTFTVAAVILWGISFWSIVLGLETSAPKRKYWGALLFNAFGFGFLLLIPPILFFPML